MRRSDRFLIAPLQSGQQTNLKPWLIPDDAFEQLTNAYVFRGRVVKRFGSRYLRPSSPAPSSTSFESLPSRLRIKLGTTDGAGALSGTVPGSTFGIGQMFSVGTDIYTVDATGTPATMLTTSGTGTGTYNTTTGAYAFTSAGATTDVYFYPAEPVMGLINYENSAVNLEPTFAFDTQFAYQFTTSGWDRLGSAVWTGSNSDFFWGTNWRGTNSYDTYLFVTNYNTGSNLNDSDPMRYWNGATWNDFQPRFDSATATNTVLSARVIVPFKDRLVLLNVVENTGAAPGTNRTYVNRCRFSWNGNPADSTAFYEDQAGKGGYIDAPTKEAIITAQFLYDRLIVYFERSTWELVYTGNQILPFVWQKINTELGAESTFSQVPFDKVVLGVGNVGIHACNGSNVDRIDQKIPDEVFTFHNANNGLERVAGIRDYFREMVYWTFPSYDRGASFPYNDRVLVYNYKTGSWAFNNDSITAFGYFQSETTLSQQWQQIQNTWAQERSPWRGTVSQIGFRDVIAGNQEGYTFIIDSTLTSNVPALQITDLSISGNTITITSYNHNLKVTDESYGDYVRLDGIQGITGTINDTIYAVDSVTDANTFVVKTDETLTGTYTGGGTIQRVSNINILTKQYNFYVKNAKKTALNRIDFLLNRTENGQVCVDYFASTSSQSLLNGGTATGAVVDTGVVETSPYTLVGEEDSQVRLWRSSYPIVNGQSIQFRIYMNDTQMKDEDISLADFSLHAMILYTNPTDDLL